MSFPPSYVPANPAGTGHGAGVGSAAVMSASSSSRTSPTMTSENQPLSSSASPSLSPSPAASHMSLSTSPPHVYIYIASTGRLCYEFILNSSENVSTLKQRLATLTDIAMQDQILLLPDGVKLDATRHTDLVRLSSFHHAEVILYLFNRRHLAIRDAVGEATNMWKQQQQAEMEQVEMKLPPMNAASLIPTPYINASSSPMVRMLPEFERAFSHHIETADAYVANGNKRVQMCQLLQKQQRIQLLALDAAVKNLNGHHKKMCTLFLEFHDRYTRLDSHHQSLLDSFEYDLSRLREIDLHPVLRRNDRTTLLDCVSEGKWRNFSSQCQKECDVLRKKISDLVIQHRSVNDGVDQLQQPLTQHLTELDMMTQQLMSIDETRRDQPIWVQSLLSDHDKVQRVVLETEASLRDHPDIMIKPGDACAAFEVQNHMHQNDILKRFKETDEKLKGVMQAYAESQIRVSCSFFTKMLRISELSSLIKKLECSIHLYNEGINRQSQMFVKLGNIQQIPQAYHAALIECVRRKAFRNAFHAEAKEWAERLTRLRNEELPKREMFHTKHGQYLPHGFIPGLNERPPLCEIRFTDSDTTLPDLDPSAIPQIPSTQHHTSEMNESTYKKLLDENIALRAELALKKMSTSASPSLAPSPSPSPSPSPASNAAPVTTPTPNSASTPTPTPAIDVSAAVSADVSAAAADHASALATQQQHHREIETKLRQQYEASQQALKQVEQQLKELNEKWERLQATQHVQAATAAEPHQTPTPTSTAISASSAPGTPTSTTPQPLFTSTSPKLTSLASMPLLPSMSSHATPTPSTSSPIFTPTSRQLTSPPLLKEDPRDTIASILDGSNVVDEKDVGAIHTRYRSQIQILAKYIASLRTKLTQRTSDLKTCQSNSVDLENRLAEANKEVKACKAQWNKTQAELARAQAEVSKAQAEILSLSKNSSHMLESMKEAQKEAQEVATLRKELQRLRDSEDLWQHIASMKISFTTFAVNDLALFLKNANGFYEAFNHQLPHRYLSEETKLAASESDRLRDSVIGRILFIEQHEAGTTERENPYRLPPKTIYYRFTCQLVELHSETQRNIQTT